MGALRAPIFLFLDFGLALSGFAQPFCHFALRMMMSPW